MRIPFISLIAASSIALGGCAYGNFGFGMGYGDYGYGSYGYRSPYSGYGYGYSSPYSGYGYGYGSPYDGYGYGSPYWGSRYGSPYYGWYNGYYYPGSGYYVYDSYRRPRLWSDTQQRYWTRRRQAVTSRSTTSDSTTPNWSGFERVRPSGSTSTLSSEERAQRRAEWIAR